MLLTREMFCGAAFSALIGLGLGTWMTPDLRAAESDSHTDITFAFNAPADPAGSYGIAPEDHAALSQVAWTPDPPDPQDSQPEADPRAPDGQGIDRGGPSAEVQAMEGQALNRPSEPRDMLAPGAGSDAASFARTEDLPPSADGFTRAEGPSAYRPEDGANR